jgi:hypothetical protein
MEKEPDKCKFCGLHDTKIEGTHGSYHVICCCCEAQGPKGHTKEAAVSLWNGSPKVELELRSRSEDTHCQLKGDAKIWDCGRTSAEAIGRWITAHGSDFGIEVSHEPLIRQSLVASTCDYKPNSGEPCSSCPRQMSQLYRCGFLQEEAEILQEGQPEHNPLNS